MEYENDGLNFICALSLQLDFGCALGLLHRLSALVLLAHIWDGSFRTPTAENTHYTALFTAILALNM